MCVMRRGSCMRASAAFARLWLELRGWRLARSRVFSAAFQLGHQPGLQNVFTHSAHGAEVFAQMGRAAFMEPLPSFGAGCEWCHWAGFFSTFSTDVQCELAVGLSRQGVLRFDLSDEDSMAQCAAALRDAAGPYGAVNSNSLWMQRVH